MRSGLRPAPTSRTSRDLKQFEIARAAAHHDLLAVVKAYSHTVDLVETTGEELRFARQRLKKSKRLMSGSR